MRVVPGASARWGSYLAPGVILMPSYVNIGARVGADTMVDTWATVGSCAQIGERVHLSGGVGIGGVLEPPQAAPVIVGDDCTIGSRCMVTQGARVGNGCVLGEGVHPQPGHPGDRRRRRARRSSRGVVPPGAIVGAGRRGRGRSRAASSACRACSIMRRLDRGRAPRQGASSTTSCATTGSCDVTAGSVLDHDATDLFGLTAALVAVPSESHHEAELADDRGRSACGHARRHSRSTSSAPA